MISMDARATVWKIVEISAAHCIPNHPGKCARPHGHNYKIEVGIAGDINPETGMVKDFYEVKQDIAETIEGPCDHQDLNKVYPGLLTTAENLAVLWLAALRARDPRYCAIRVWETASCLAEVTTR